MSEIFISYARETVADAQRIADALRDEGYSVWQDVELPAHRPFFEVIEERLAIAKAVVVLWSKQAVVSQWVRSEASRARKDSKLVQVSLDTCPPPMPFDQFQCIDLSRWSGDRGDAEWRKVLSNLSKLISGVEVADNVATPLRDDLPTWSMTEMKPGRPALQKPSKPSIAVLPFKDTSPDAETSYFADAVGEGIVTALCRYQAFFVIAADSSFRYKSQTHDIARVSRELGVRYIVEGSVRKLAERVRITAQLIDARDSSTVWADRFDCEQADILSMQDSLIEQIVTAIEPAVLHSEGAYISHKSLNDYNALDCFYRGMWHLNRVSKDDYNSALGLFREAIRRDPELAIGYIGLSRILFGGAVFGWTDRAADDLQEARASAQTAISLEPRDAYAYYASAGPSLYLADHGAALAEAKAAIRLNANCALAHMRLGQVLIFCGRPAEAIDPIEHCVRLSPFDSQLGVMLESLALAYYQVHDYQQAIVHAEAAMHHRHLRESVILAASLAKLGHLEEAGKALPKFRSKSVSLERPLAAPYSDESFAEHLRAGIRLARKAARE